MFLLQIENTAEVYTKDITNENLGINIFQILSSTSVVVFELVIKIKLINLIQTLC